MAARITGHAKTAFRRAWRVKGQCESDRRWPTPIFWMTVSGCCQRWASRSPQPFADNAAFVLNAVENLTGSDDLISLRTRANTDRPFIVVQAMQTPPSSNSARPSKPCRPA